MLFKDNIHKSKIRRTADEAFRVYRYVEQLHSWTKPRGKVVTYKGHFLNWAFAVDGNYYERITYAKPTTAVLETSLNKWRVKGVIRDLTKIHTELLNSGWKLMNPALIGQDTKLKEFKAQMKELIEENDPFLNIKFENLARAEKERKERLENEPLIKKQIPSWFESGSKGQNDEHRRALEFQRSELEKLKSKKTLVRRKRK